MEDGAAITERLTRTDVERALRAPVAEASPAEAESGAARPLRRAAVLCPILERPDGLHVLLTLRAAHLKAHAGQVAFPGGKIDPCDRSPLAAALREAQEEIGLCPHRVEIAGMLPSHNTTTGFLVTPFVGFVDPRFRPVADPNEVAEVFSAPLDFLMDLRNHSRHTGLRDGRQRLYYAIPYNGLTIWGATAAMLRTLSDRLGREMVRDGAADRRDDALIAEKS